VRQASFDSTRFPQQWEQKRHPTEPWLMRTGSSQAPYEFAHPTGTPSFANDENVVLDRDKSLAAEHVHDGDTLHLVDVGGGV
jgi:hypothetical protein